MLDEIKLNIELFFEELRENRRLKKEEKKLEKELKREARLEALKESKDAIKEKYKRQYVERATGERGKKFLKNLSEGFKNSSIGDRDKLKDMLGNSNSLSRPRVLNPNSKSQKPEEDYAEARIRRMLGGR